MKILFAHPMHKGKPVTDSYGNQEVIAGMLTDGDMIVLLVDHGIEQVFIEKLKNRFAVDLYRSDNFERIEDEQEWKNYMNFFRDTQLIPSMKYV